MLNPEVDEYHAGLTQNNYEGFKVQKYILLQDVDTNIYTMPAFVCFLIKMQLIYLGTYS